MYRCNRHACLVPVGLIVWGGGGVRCDGTTGIVTTGRKHKIYTARSPTQSPLVLLITMMSWWNDLHRGKWKYLDKIVSQ